ncbi:MAG: 3-phosphoshikimate 1-carboxyvinyltransferase [Polyangiaceae bacterium]|nr:3-phosphoshikimate 1-carboxyvinyltransferase [Polyangiaceae bacterium]
MTDLVVEPQHKPLTGVVPVPSDKSITHRALLLAAIAEGESVVVCPHMGEDNRSTLAAIRALGARVSEQGAELRITGTGLLGLTAPAEPIDCGNSGTTMRLLAGVLAAQRFRTVLIGDASLSRRPMARIVGPLRQRGARLEGALDPSRPGDVTAPLEIGPLPAPNVLSALAFESPIASAQVKSALLLSGLWADGNTIVREPVVSRDHTERMLDGLGVPIERVGSVVSLDGHAFSGSLPAFSLTVPGDLSAAAFLLAAASLIPGSEIGVRAVGANPTRAGFVDALRLLGGRVELAPERYELGEPIGAARAGFSELHGATLAGELVARSIDEIPILSALAARARGTTIIADASELRVKESDRLACMAEVLRAFGVGVEETRSGLVIEGRPDGPLSAATVDCCGDHRIAMSAAVLALCADGPCRVLGVDAVATSFPRFAGTMRALGASVRAV